MSLDGPAISELRATAHPIRLRMLSLLTGAALSAADLGRELDITQANASYHLRTLARAGQVEVAATETVRGGQAKKYRYRYPEQSPTAQQPRHGVSADAAEFRRYLEALHHELVRRAAHRVAGPAISSDAEVWLTPDVWRRAHDLVKAASMLVHEEALPPHAAGSVHVNFQTELFQLRDERDDQGSES